MNTFIIRAWISAMTTVVFLVLTPVSKQKRIKVDKKTCCHTSKELREYMWEFISIIFQK